MAYGQEIRYSFRSLAKAPGFTAVIVLTLGLSIGANTAIFSVINSVLLKPLPYPEPNRLVRVYIANTNYAKFRLNPFDFLDYRDRNVVFERMAGFVRHDVQLFDQGHPERLAALQITADYFQVLGFRPAMGREFTRADERPGAERQIILSDHLWRNQFGRDYGVLGRKVMIDSQPFVVIGVMPSGVMHVGNDRNPLAHGDTVDAWLPFTFQGNPAERGSHYVDAVARLKPGRAPEQAFANMTQILGQLALEHPNFNRDWRIRMIPLQEDVVGPTQRMLLVLLGAVAMVLLIACVNAANLMLARATARRREMAVRAALGASRMHLIRQMLVESLLISLFGAVLGVGLASVGLRVLIALLPVNFPRAGEIHIDGAVFAFTLGIALATGVFFGLAPALQTSKTDLNQTLREGGRSASSGLHPLRLRNVLVVAEVALSSILLIGAGLLSRSFVNLLRMDPGFQPEHTLTGAISLPAETYKDANTVSAFYGRLLARLSLLPGVRAVGVGSDLPWTGYNENTSFDIEGKKPAPGASFHSRYHVASNDYFRALGVPLAKGRFFTDADNATAKQIVIVNRAFERLYLKGEDAVGKRLTFVGNPKERDWYTIAGVVQDIKDAATSAGAEPAFWWPLLQQPFGISDMRVVLRANAEPALLANALRREVSQVDPALAVAQIHSMDQIASASVSTPRFTLSLVGLFSTLALVLAAIGTYGVMSYSVTRRIPEFGIRLALGASRAGVLRLVLTQGLRLTLLGILLGLAGAVVLARLLTSLLYEVSPLDPATFGGVALLSTVVAMAACCVPAQKATRADPMSALRCE